MKLYTRQLKIFLYWGKKGSGKSLIQAYVAYKLFKDYYRQEKKYPLLPHRTYWSSQKLSKEIEDKELGKHLEYWTSPKQLYQVRNSDIGWDEIGKDLPAGSWSDTPKELKQIFSHLRKRGNRLFANTQVYEDIDIAFRRQVDIAINVKKIMGSADISASLPSPRFIWGVLMGREFDPLDLEVEKKNRIPMFKIPIIVFIRKKLINLYDTRSEIPPYMPDSLDHKEYKCIEKGCNKIHIEHRKI